MPGGTSRVVRGFQTTQWGLVRRAGHGDTQALEQLLQQYMGALRTFLVRQKRLPREKADDLLQGFVLEKILRGGLLAKAQPQGGRRFRTFLLTSLQRYIVSEWRKEHSLKRGGGRGAPVPFDELPEVADGEPRPDREMELLWIRSVLDATLERMRAECRERDNQRLWELFEARIVKPALEGAPTPKYDALVARFGFASPSAVSQALMDAKGVFRRHLLHHVWSYVGGQAEAEAELKDLIGILAAGDAK